MKTNIDTQEGKVYTNTKAQALTYDVACKGVSQLIGNVV